jgi:purine-binding chemotaxis protein CheW
MEEKSQTIESFLSFQLEDETFAVNVHKVLEVLEKQHITKVPNAPRYIKGVINFRGEVIPVIESRDKFNMTPRQADDKLVIIVLDVKKHDHSLMVAAIADEVRDVLEITPTMISEVPEMGSNYNTEFILGMVKADEGFMMILDIDKIFAEDEINLLKVSKQKVEM